MPEPAPSPFLAIPSAEWVCANGLAVAIYSPAPETESWGAESVPKEIGVTEMPGILPKPGISWRG